MNARKTILKVNRLGHHFQASANRLDVLHDISFEIAAGELVLVQGESGCGKTTLLLDCGAMQTPSSGDIEINQTHISELPPTARNQFRAKHIGYLFQTLQLIPYLSLLDNVRLVQGVPLETAERCLERLGLADRRTHKPNALSHGQRQRGALARAIVHRPSIVIADEPTGNLDPDNAQLVFEVLREIADHGSAVLVATHDSIADSSADRIYRIESGTLTDTKGTI